MTLQQLLDYCNYVLSKNQKGNTIDPDEISLVVENASTDFYEYWLREMIKAKQLPMDLMRKIFNSSPLKKFTLEKEWTNVGASTELDLPDNFRAALIATCTTVPLSYPTGTTPPSTLKPFDLFTEEEFNVLRSSMLSQDFGSLPGGVIRGLKLKVIGKGINSINMVYYRRPVNPFYDYYILNDVVTYLPPGYFVVSTGVDYTYNVYVDRGTSSELIASNVYYPLYTSAGAGTRLDSRSVELEWDSEHHLSIANLILERMGISNRDMSIYQYAAAPEQQQR